MKQLKFKLDYTESPFWAIDEATKSKFGYNVDLSHLELHSNTVIRIKSITHLYQEKLNPVYQLFPSFWSGRMNLFFQMFTQQVFSEIENEIGQEYQIINEEFALMNEEINIEEIDKSLNEFIENPSKYADKKGIIYTSKAELKAEIQKAYQAWERKEFKWITL